jgi:hypothetical protein
MIFFQAWLVILQIVFSSLWRRHVGSFCRRVAKSDVYKTSDVIGERGGCVYICKVCAGRRADLSIYAFVHGAIYVCICKHIRVYPDTVVMFCYIGQCPRCIDLSYQLLSLLTL